MQLRKFFILLILMGSLLNETYCQKEIEGMVLIPAGEFIMGKDSEQGHDYSPAHKVVLNAFLLDKTEVTNAEYLKFCQATEHRLPLFWNTPPFQCGEKFPDYPVVGVSWADAKAYATWVGKRLPTEAEWEYAARGGLVQNEYPNGNKWTFPKAIQNKISWTNLTRMVGQKKPNGYGLFDMGGNVWEWVADRYSADYYTLADLQNPQGPDVGANRVIRGGSWLSGAMCKRVYYRKNLPSNWCDFAVGFRCVQDIE